MGKWADGFTLMGPLCESPDCAGILVHVIDTRTQESFKRCSKCRREYHRMPVDDMRAYAKRVLHRALMGEKEA